MSSHGRRKSWGSLPTVGTGTKLSSSQQQAALVTAHYSFYTEWNKAKFGTQAGLCESKAHYIRYCCAFFMHLGSRTSSSTLVIISLLISDSTRGAPRTKTPFSSTLQAFLRCREHYYSRCYLLSLRTPAWREVHSFLLTLLRKRLRTRSLIKKKKEEEEQTIFFHYIYRSLILWDMQRQQLLLCW